MGPGFSGGLGLTDLEASWLPEEGSWVKSRCAWFCYFYFSFSEWAPVVFPKLFWPFINVFQIQ